MVKRTYLHKRYIKNNPLIKCHCGCGLTRVKFDKNGVERKYMGGHTSRRNIITIPNHCNDLAWFLGVLCGDGHISLKSTKRVSLGVTSKDFVLKFKNSGEKLFNIKSGPIKQLKRVNKNWNPIYQVRFGSETMVDYFGDFRCEPIKWVETIKKKHSWIFNDENYIVYFLLGLFDSEGHVSFNKKYGYKFCLSIKPIEGRILIKKLFNKIGFDIKIDRDGIVFYSIKTIKSFLVKYPFFVSCVYNKREERLEKIRKYVKQ